MHKKPKILPIIVSLDNEGQ